MEQIQSHDERDESEPTHHTECERKRNVRDTKEPVAERVHHIEDGVEQGDDTEELRKLIDGVEDASQVGQWGEHEGRHDVDGIEGLRVDGVNESEEREQ